MLPGVQGRRWEPARLRGEALQLQSQPSLGKEHHRDTYLEQQQTEKNETEVSDRIRITKVYTYCPEWPSGWS